MNGSIVATYAVHIVAGSLGILSGFAALAVTKGAALHRRIGMVFVYAMLTTAAVGLLIAVTRGVAPSINIPAAILTSYLVLTGFLTVRPVFSGSRELGIALMAVALGTGLVELVMGLQAVAAGGRRAGFAFSFLLFAFVGLAGGFGDLRVVRHGARKGPFRLARHLWRMSFALFIAALSFFIGQQKVFPASIRKPPLLALPVLTVLIAMGYWLWRIRFRRSLKGIIQAQPRERDSAVA